MIIEVIKNYNIDLFQCLIISNSLLALSYLALTGFAHLMKIKATVFLAQWFRLISLLASALITIVLRTYGVSAIVFAFHSGAVYGVFWLFIFVWVNSVALQQYKRLSEVVTANLLIAVMLLLFKLQHVTTNTPAGPQGLCWILYSLFYLSAVFGFILGGDTAHRWSTVLGNQLGWIDAYVRADNYEDFAMRNTCALCFCLLNLTCFVIVGHPIASYGGVLLLLQFIVTLTLALRFSALCPNATLEHGFVIATCKQIGASIATAWIQRSRGVLPAFNPWLLVVALFSGLTHTNVAYCGSGSDEIVTSPVCEGAARSRGASMAGEAFNIAGQWAQANPHASG